jgi:predicted nucleic acid-binding protein
MNLIDANVFIRYLIGDDATKQRKSKELIERIRAGQEEAFTTDVIVHEVCYVLSASTHYNLSHQNIRDRLYPIRQGRRPHRAESARQSGGIMTGGSTRRQRRRRLLTS